MPEREMSPVFIGDIPRYGIQARGQEIDGEFVVYKGSKARRTWEGAEGSHTKLFNHLVTQGVLKPTPDGTLNEFAEYYVYSSPSAAAAVVAGRSANGRSHWVFESTKQTYGDWQADQVTQATATMQTSEEDETTGEPGTN